jgi:adenylate cyclase
LTRWKSALIGLIAAAAVSFFYITGLLEPLENRLYDLYLHFRADRERIDNVVFIDVDDGAIAFNGVFPWPRSVPADGLLRLKEYGAGAAIFDIEFIDQGPQGVDTVYLNNNLYPDVARSFNEVNEEAQAIFQAFGAGRLGRSAVTDVAGGFSSSVEDQRESLYRKLQAVARDNDLYLAQASALFGKSWSTLNLRVDPLVGEQAERLALAEKRFSYPVQAAANAHLGDVKEGFIDILPALPSFAEAAQGSGFTNVTIDSDGVRRRIYLAQNIKDHWYLQLAFAPLVYSMGNPALELHSREMIIKMPEKTIRVPLDPNGAMLLDWPKTDFFDSYSHISFAELSQLDVLETEMEQYARYLSGADLAFFANFDPAFDEVRQIAGDLSDLYDAIAVYKARALESASDEDFSAYTDYRARARGLLARIGELGLEGRLDEIMPAVIGEFPGDAAAIGEEAEYISNLAGYIAVDLKSYEETAEKKAAQISGKFCILGRSDTGTTDYGVNPFYGRYVNVGTHAVVLDTILSESFITYLSLWWSVLFCLVFIPLFFFFSANLSQKIRTACGFAVMLLIALISVLLFRFTGVFFGALGLLIALAVAVIAREILSYAGSEREKQFIRKAFSTYVSGDIVEEIIKDPSRLQLGGSKRFMSAIFTDIRGFSTISEQLDPEDLVSLLNRYLTAMSNVVMEKKGTIDKYEGDAIIAFFGAPLDLPEHAFKACESAITMKKLEAELNKTILEEKLSPGPLLTRIGINTGYMVAGNMGAENKLDYTIMGNAVILAARLEGVNKQYGTWILATDTTIQEAAGRILTRKLDRVRVVGINEPVRLHNVLAVEEEATDEMRAFVGVFHNALDLFEERKFKEAVQGFKEAQALIAADGPSKIYLDRCKAYLAKPPEDGWDGVYNLTEK